MRLSRALSLIEKDYHPGIREYFSNHISDPWQKAHDVLEGQMLIHRGNEDYTEKMEQPIQDFCDEILKLIKSAKYIVDHSERLDIADVFYLRDEDKIKKLDALRAGVCEGCGITDQTKVYVPKKSKSGIFCENCIDAMEQI